MIYSAFLTVLISVRILPVGFDSSGGSSAGASAEGECAIAAALGSDTPRELGLGSCARAAGPGQLCQGSFQELAGTEGRDSAVPTWG